MVRDSSSERGITAGTLRILVRRLLLHVAISTVAAQIERAEQLRLTGRYDEATELFGKAKKEQPVFAALEIARCRMAQGKYDEAQELLSLAVDELLGNGELQGEMAFLHFRIREYTREEEYFDLGFVSPQNQDE